MKFAFRGTRAQLLLLIFSMVLGAYFVVQGALTVRFFLFATQADAGMRAAGIGMSLCLAAVGIWFMLQGWRRLTDDGNDRWIGPEGIRDARLSRRTIPWKDMRNLRVQAAEPQGSALVFDLAEGADARARITTRARRMVTINRTLGFSYRVRKPELSVEELTAAVTPYVMLEKAD